MSFNESHQLYLHQNSFCEMGSLLPVLPVTVGSGKRQWISWRELCVTLTIRFPIVFFKSPITQLSMQMNVFFSSYVLLIYLGSFVGSMQNCKGLFYHYNPFLTIPCIIHLPISMSAHKNGGILVLYILIYARMAIHAESPGCPGMMPENYNSKFGPTSLSIIYLIGQYLKACPPLHYRQS